MRTAKISRFAGQLRLRAVPIPCHGHRRHTISLIWKLGTAYASATPAIIFELCRKHGARPRKQDWPRCTTNAGVETTRCGAPSKVQEGHGGQPCEG